MIDITASKYKQILKLLDSVSSKIEKAGISKDFILKYAFGDQSLEELDEYKEEVLRASLDAIRGKFFLKNEV